MERLELRKQTSEEFKALSGAANEAGVQNLMFGVFHDAGYKGLYGGLGIDAIKARKGIPEKEQLMDRMDTTELAANQFRMTQTREKLARQQTINQEQAIETHKQVGREVRAAIKRIGGTLPGKPAPGRTYQASGEADQTGDSETGPCRPRRQRADWHRSGNGRSPLRGRMPTLRMPRGTNSRAAD